MADLKALYRLIILYLLDRSEVPVTGTQITSFILEKGYTDYFTVQSSLKDLAASGLIIADSKPNNTIYRITNEGKDTLGMLGARISDSIKRDVNDFLNSGKKENQNESELSAEYFKNPDGRYSVRCQIVSGGHSVLDLTIEVTHEAEAVTICRNWREQHLEVYADLIELLLQ